MDITEGTKNLNSKVKQGLVFRVRSRNIDGVNLLYNRITTVKTKKAQILG